MKVLLIVFVILITSFLCAFPFMWIWNYAVVKCITIAAPINDFWVAFWMMAFLNSFKGDQSK
jgi:hypothetical protein